jgi:predicted nucleic acid-binding protein
MPAPIVVYDACVLFPPSLRDLLMRIAAADLVRARWSEEILDEVFDNIALKRPDLDAARLKRTRQLMCEAIPECLVSRYQSIVDDLELPDPNDRHVLAAALRARAGVIVTANLRDFPQRVLAPLGVVAQHPDEFVLGVIRRTGRAVGQLVEEQAKALKNPPMDVDRLLERLEQAGLRASVAELRLLLNSGGDE